MKRLPWKYSAGFIDGEGCLDLSFQKKMFLTPRVRVCQSISQRNVVEMLKNSYGGYTSIREVTNPKWQDSIEWSLWNYKRVCPFLRNIAKHLIVKKEQARFILWMEKHLKGKAVTYEVGKAVQKQMSLMKKDPHRLSERAVKELLPILPREVYENTRQIELFADAIVG